MTDPFDFSSRSVAVIGGTSGINLGIAEAFATHGARVAVLSRTQEKIDAAVARLSAHGGEVAGYRADVREPAALEAAFTAMGERFGTLDVVVSGAAGNFPAPALGMSPNGFKAVVDIDLLGTFNALRAAHGLLRKPGGTVINISAPQALLPMEYQIHVCAAKAGVDMVTRVLALEWGGEGIRVNSIVPGPIADTEGMRRLAPTAVLERRATQSVPLQRYGTADDIANMALMLCSPLASYVTGAVIPVDGGWSLGGAQAAMGELARWLREQPGRGR